uniref:Fibrous sheath CABYR-binding protein-like n=1 Tax=Seriola dumerili TaxID=41447 RepID=A0A3B4TFY1_SERDU
MGDPATLVESATPAVITAIPTVVAGETQDGAKTQSANKNGKKADSGSSSSFFTWFIVLALLGVWTSVAVVYFDLVDYQGVLGKLVAYDTDGDGDFDVEDAKVLLGLTSEGDGQGESEVLDWLEEVEEGGSDWFNSFVTFLYGLINPLEPVEDEELGISGEVVGVHEEDEDEEDERGVRRRGAKDDGNQGQKIVIVGLHNQ